MSVIEGSVMEETPAADMAKPIRSNDRVTVHNYTTVTSSSLRSSSELLDTARHLIDTGSSRNSTGWKSMKEPEVLLWVPGNLYAYNGSPPRVERDSQQSGSIDNLKEWGTPVEKSEVYSLLDLEEFESTEITLVVPNDQHYVISSPLASVSTPQTAGEETGMKRRLPQEEAAPTQAGPIPPTKRRKLDDGPLYTLLPRPHIYPSLALDKLNPTHTVTIKPYKRTKPIILAPYTDPLPPPAAHDRRAWIIPIRGRLPWDLSTPAELLDTRETDPPSTLRPVPPAPRSLEPIAWTRAALVAFWDFIKFLRSDGKLGSLGVAFHASANYTRREGSRGSSNSAGTREQEGQGWHQSISLRSLSGPSKEAGEFAPAGPSGASIKPSQVHKEGTALSSVDHIKVYHDASKSMILRTALDVWAYDMKDGSERLRMLKGAKLVLVDHLSRGILIS